MANDEIKVPKLSNVRWITNQFDHIYAAEIHLCQNRINFTLSTITWQQSDNWKQWIEDVVTIANEKEE